MREELIKCLIDSIEFNSKLSFTNEDRIKELCGEKLYKSIYDDFYDHWTYELSERLDTIDIKALITAAVEKAIDQQDSQP